MEGDTMGVGHFDLTLTGMGLKNAKNLVGFLFMIL